MNELKHLSRFQKALAHYRISPASQQVLDNTRVALLLAPTAGGRNTIINELTKTGRYHYLISSTTRKPRENNGVLEQTGKEYWFRSEEGFLEDLEQGKFVEAEVIHEQQVSGINVRDVEDAQKAGKVGITDIDLVGMQNVVATKPDTVAFLVLPPSFEEWQRRMNLRGVVPPIEVARRMRTAIRIFEASLTSMPYLHFVINDQMEQAAQQVDAIVQATAVDPDTEEAGRQLVQDFLAKTRAFLDSHQI